MKSSEHIARAFDDAVQADFEAMQEVLAARMPVSDEFQELPHPFVLGAHPGPTVGPLGLVNCVLEMLGHERIAAVYDKTAEGDVLTGFVVHDTREDSKP